MCCFFFFQAEDGIRDLVRSRGLGDVYKRQATDLPVILMDEPTEGLDDRSRARVLAAISALSTTVSYTHLTLPTSDLV